MKTTLTVDQLKALRARWRENNNGFGDFANMVWGGYRLQSPIGRLLGTSPILHDMSAVRLTDATYDDGYVYSGDYDAWKKRPLALSPIAAAMAAHCREFARARVLRGSRNKVPLHPQALDDAIAYARERAAILTEVDKALKGRMARNLGAWRRLLGLLEAEGEKVAA